MRIALCKIADKEHAASKRQYSHTYHKKGVVCIAGAFLDLPDGYKAGILAHEYGHAIAVDNLEQSEDMADFLAKKYLKIKMTRLDSPHGKNLQWTSPKNLGCIIKAIRKL